MDSGIYLVYVCLSEPPADIPITNLAPHALFRDTAGFLVKTAPPPHSTICWGSEEGRPTYTITIPQRHGRMYRQTTYDSNTELCTTCTA